MVTLESNLIIENKWKDKTAEKMNESELLLYRSNLLGSDKRITNYGGGNTSAKIYEKDPLSRLNPFCLSYLVDLISYVPGLK